MAGMKGRRLTFALLILLALLVLALPIAGYFASYIACTTEIIQGPTGARARVYETSYQAHVFRPASQIESQITGHEMYTTWDPHAP
jgi:hypothetical protein